MQVKKTDITDILLHLGRKEFSLLYDGNCKMSRWAHTNVPMTSRNILYAKQDLCIMTWKLLT